jgi:hypothetical protein
VRPRTRHLPEDSLLNHYVAERNGESLDPGHGDHLNGCAECTGRYHELVAFMDGLRFEADAETDRVFDAERLRTQQQIIKRRLEHLGHVARVISFPARFGLRVTATAARVAPRWIAGAAAAGLFVGVAAGRVYDLTHPAWHAPVTSATVARIVPVENQSARSEAAAIEDDLTFMSELETALEHPRTRELMPFDEMTPHDMADTVVSNTMR